MDWRSLGFGFFETQKTLRNSQRSRRLVSAYLARPQRTLRFKRAILNRQAADKTIHAERLESSSKPKKGTRRLCFPSCFRRVGICNQNLEKRLDRFLTIAIHTRPHATGSFEHDSNLLNRVSLLDAFLTRLRVALTRRSSLRNVRSQFLAARFAFDPTAHSTGWCHDWEAVSFCSRAGSFGLVDVSHSSVRSMDSVPRHVRLPLWSHLRPGLPTNCVHSEWMRQRCLRSCSSCLRQSLLCSSNGGSARDRDGHAASPGH